MAVDNYPYTGQTEQLSLTFKTYLTQCLDQQGIDCEGMIFSKRDRNHIVILCLEKWLATEVKCALRDGYEQTLQVYPVTYPEHPTGLWVVDIFAKLCLEQALS